MNPQTDRREHGSGRSRDGHPHEAIFPFRGIGAATSLCEWLIHRSASSNAVRASVFSSRYFTMSGVDTERPC